MLTMKEITRLFRVEPGSRLRLKKHDTAWAGDRDLQRLKSDELKEKARSFVEQNLVKLAEAQERLASNDIYSILGGAPGDGRRGQGRHGQARDVGLESAGLPGVQLQEALRGGTRPRLPWRYWRALPERGRIGIFNRSYYEEMLIVRVHPELLERSGCRRTARQVLLARPLRGHQRLRAAPVRNGTLVLKFFLNISKEEQKKRFMERLDGPDKHWKFEMGDLHERAVWDEYQEAFEDTLTHTSTDWAPWWVIPSTTSGCRGPFVSAILAEAIQGLGLKPRRITEAQMSVLAEARKQLLAESES